MKNINIKNETEKLKNIENEIEEELKNKTISIHTLYQYFLILSFLSVIFSLYSIFQDINGTHWMDYGIIFIIITINIFVFFKVKKR